MVPSRSRRGTAAAGPVPAAVRSERGNKTSVTPTHHFMVDGDSSQSTGAQSSSTSASSGSRRSTKPSSNESVAPDETSTSATLGANKDSNVKMNGSKLTAIKPNTRGRNGIRKMISKQSYSPSAEQHFKRAASATNMPGAGSIEGCAAMLASVDKRSYSRALLRDADAILENVIFPMGFPWTHRLETQSRIIPRDIDEMPGVRAAEAVDQLKGEIEYTTLSQSTLSRKALVSPSKRDDYKDEDINIPGELSFRMFQEVQARKRQRIELFLVGKEENMISN